MQRTKRSDYSALLSDANELPLRQSGMRQVQFLEAEVLPGDTIVSVSLRFNCTIADIKRLNKIDKDSEIYAFKVLKVPLTAHNILLDTLPKVHKSGQNSPTSGSSTSKEKVSASDVSKEKLEEKLLVASVSNAVLTTSGNAADRSVNTLESSVEDLSAEPLLDNTQFRGYIRTFGAPRNDYLSFNGNDCELNWIALLICILALCVIVPLIYVYIAYEHPEDFTHSKYDDTDLKKLHHLNDNHTVTTRKP